MKPFALLLFVSLACACTRSIDPAAAPNEPFASGSESAVQSSDSPPSVLPPPPSGTLRAPADARTEEVESTSGLPSAQSQ